MTCSLLCPRCRLQLQLDPHRRTEPFRLWVVVTVDGELIREGWEFRSDHSSVFFTDVVEDVLRRNADYSRDPTAGGVMAFAEEYFTSQNQVAQRMTVGIVADLPGSTAQDVEDLITGWVSHEVPPGWSGAVKTKTFPKESILLLSSSPHRAGVSTHSSLERVAGSSF
jgi:hypothetical protein